MKKLLSLTIFSFVLSSHSISQEKVTKSEIYEFANFILDSPTKTLNLEEDADQWIIEHKEDFLHSNTIYFGYDSVHFSKEDLKFMENQLRKSKSFKWEKDSLKQNLNIIPNKDFEKLFEPDDRKGWERFNEKYGGGRKVYQSLFSPLTKLFA